MPLPIIFVSSQQETIDQAINHYLQDLKLSADAPSVLYLSEKLGIDQIKKINQHFLWKDNSHSGRVMILNPADSLTTDAQNGLLKILEEATENSHLILGITDESHLLPTVLSRCEIRNLSSNDSKTDHLIEIETLLGMGIEDRLEQIEKMEDRKLLVSQISQFYYFHLPQQPKLAEGVKIVLNCHAWIKQNVSAKAVTDFLMIKLPRYQK